MTHMTAPYTPMQNETLERANWTIGDAVRAMLTRGGMEAKHWAKVACGFVHTKNAMPRMCFSWKSAWEVVTGQSPPSLPDFFFCQKILVYREKSGRLQG